MREKFKALKERFNSESGFTLIELMATLAILALIVVIAVPAIGNIITSAGEDSLETTVDMIERSAEIAYVESIGSDGSGTATFTVGGLVTDGFLDLDLPYSSGGEEIDGAEEVTKDAGKGASFTLQGVTLP